MVIYRIINLKFKTLKYKIYKYFLKYIKSIHFLIGWVYMNINAKKMK